METTLKIRLAGTVAAPQAIAPRFAIMDCLAIHGVGGWHPSHSIFFVSGAAGW
jgi:hypothetical protein